MKIYVPDLKNYKCFVVQGEGVIRAYKEVPKNNTTVSYRDYYINSDYIYRDGSQQFSQYGTVPVCLVAEDVTSDVYYRLDFDKILIIFIILAFVCLWCPWKIFCRFFRRFN